MNKKKTMNQYLKVNKYRNIKTNGYDSKKEYRRSQELKLLLKANQISDLQEQVSYTLQPSFKINGKTNRTIKYIADFVYIKEDELIVEDVKSEITRKNPVYRIKKKMFEYKYEIEIIEI